MRVRAVVVAAWLAAVTVAALLAPGAVATAGPVLPDPPGPLLVTARGNPTNSAGVNDLTSGQVDQVGPGNCFLGSPRIDAPNYLDAWAYVSDVVLSDITSASIRRGHALMQSRYCPRQSGYLVTEVNLATGATTRLPDEKNVIAYGPEPGTLLTAHYSWASTNWRVAMIDRKTGSSLWSAEINDFNGYPLHLSADLTRFRAYGQSPGYDIYRVGDPLPTVVSVPTGRSLSPDDATVAGVVSGRLVITDVASKVDTDAGPALPGAVHFPFPTGPLGELGFSPTSTRVLYRADTPSGGRVAISTFGGTSAITDIPWPDDVGIQVSWSPDGAKVVVAQGGTGLAASTTRLVDAVSGGVVELPSASVSTQTRGLFASVRWAPDSQTFVTLGPGSTDARADALSVFDTNGVLLSEATTSHEIPALGPWPSSSLVSVVGPPARRCTITGTNKNDTLIGTPDRDVICGLGGDDVIRSSRGPDVLVGGDGVDIVDYSRSPDVVVVDMPVWYAQRRNRQQLSGIEGAVGTSGRDVLRGDDLSNLLGGGPGVDGIAANGGDDRLRGGPGGDELVGGAGADVVRGERGDDRLWVSVSDTYSGGPGKDLCHLAGASWSPCP